MKSRAPKPQHSVTSLPLLVEIGCEEIPARFLAQAEKDLGEKLQTALEHLGLLECGSSAPALSSTPQAGLSNGPKAVRSIGPHSKIGKQQAVGVWHSLSLQTYSTPRRLVTYVPAVLAKQPNKVEEITGPPVKVAFDAAGKPTRAAESFALKIGTNVADLIRVTTPKGEYLAVKKTTPGRSAMELLSEILPSVITGLAFPKSMYWVAKAGPRFVRPIRWLLALLGEGKRARVVPFEIAGVKAGDTTYGHRNHGRRPIRVQGFNDYAKELREAQVEFVPAQRRELLSQQLKVLLEESNLRIVPDPRLEDWIVNSTEWAHAMLGSFEERFLKLPREILITVMRDHQKYFAVENQAGNLQPRFITVLNVDGDPKGLIRAGHERVLTARFRDAEFFWQADQRVPLRDRLPMLERVTYQAKLGSYADKVRRMEAIAKEVCAALEKQGKMTPIDTAHALRAVQLCKCDLTTQMVQELTELQGVVGGVYAAAQGETKEVSQAIYDHFLPQGVEDQCPRSLVGAVASLADKIDGVVAGFAVGLEPTGSSDPFGLRRQGNAITKVLVEVLPRINLSDMLLRAEKEIHLLAHTPLDQLDSRVKVFLHERFLHYLTIVAKLRHDTQRAVVKAGWRGEFDALKRGIALERVRDSQDFVALSSAAKRIRNILSKSASSKDWQRGEVDEDSMDPGPEMELFQAYRAVAVRVVEDIQAENYEKALQAIATLRPSVDRFFDKVLVMAENRAVRENRLRLLGKLDELFSSIAHLSEIAPDFANVDASTLKAHDSG